MYLLTTMPAEQNNYDALYGASKELFYGESPETFVAQIPDVAASGSVLDLGAGDGRNALFLASRGFDVVAIDTSEAALQKLRSFAFDKNISIETRLEDIARLSFDQEYDVIISTFALHHLAAKDATRVLQDMKTHTRINGLNSLAVFTKNGDFFRRTPQTENFYPAEGWLKELYADWDILAWEEAEGDARAKREDGSPMRNVASRILARKRV